MHRSAYTPPTTVVIPVRSALNRATRNIQDYCLVAVALIDAVDQIEVPQKRQGASDFAGQIANLQYGAARTFV